MYEVIMGSSARLRFNPQATHFGVIKVKVDVLLPGATDWELTVYETSEITSPLRDELGAESGRFREVVGFKNMAMSADIENVLADGTIDILWKLYGPGRGNTPETRRQRVTDPKLAQIFTRYTGR